MIDRLETALAWIDAVDPAINAVVVRRGEAARNELAQVRPDVGFAGVPVVVNETVGVAGALHTLGDVRLVARRAPVDAPVVTRLRAHHALIVGLTNGPVPLDWVHTDNAVYGRTLNPHDGHRAAGGRAGGDAAIVATGAVPIAITTGDPASIVRAAGWCGVAAHTDGPYGLVARWVDDLVWARARLVSDGPPRAPQAVVVPDVSGIDVAHRAAVAKCAFALRAMGISLVASSGDGVVALVPAPGVPPPRAERRMAMPRLPTGAPVTVVRVDTDPRGLPIGVAVVGRPGDGSVTLGTAVRLQSWFGAPSPLVPRFAR